MTLHKSYLTNVKQREFENRMGSQFRSGYDGVESLIKIEVGVLVEMNHSVFGASVRPVVKEY